MLSLKQIGILLLVVIASLVLVKTDLLTKARVKATNIFYGEKVREIRNLRLVVESVSPELQKEGITAAVVQEMLTSRLETGGIKIISEEQAQGSGDVSFLNVSLSGARLEQTTYQYMVIMEIQQRKGHSTGFFQSNETVWSSSRTGAGTIEQMKKDLLKEADILLNAHSGKA
jgi:hypothetical protein